MKCDACAGALTPRHATRKAPYHYRLSGLDNVYLVGIKLYLEDELDAPIDVATRDGLHPTLRKSIEQSAIRIF